MPRRALLIAVALAVSAPGAALAASPAAEPAPHAAAATEPDPVDAHATVSQARERLAEMDATIGVLQDDADKVGDAARQKAHDAVTALKTVRDTYKKEIDGVAAEARSMTSDQVRTARAALETPYKQFESAVDADVAQFKLDVAGRKAIIAARLKAEQNYWTGVASDLETKASDFLTPEQRDAIEARVALVKHRAEDAGARLSRLAAASGSAWSVLKQGFIDSGRILVNAYDSAR